MEFKIIVAPTTEGWTASLGDLVYETDDGPIQATEGLLDLWADIYEKEESDSIEHLNGVVAYESTINGLQITSGVVEGQGDILLEINKWEPSEEPIDIENAEEVETIVIKMETDLIATMIMNAIGLALQAKSIANTYP